MFDISWQYGEDIQTTIQGDFQPVGGIAQTNQRVAKRLLTNPGAVLHHPDYGVGLPKWIGSALSEQRYRSLEADIRQALGLEASVAKTPRPTINFQLSTDQSLIGISITYYNVVEQKTAIIEFTQDR